MRVPVDLHADDLDTRLRLINHLREIREADGVSTADLDAALGVAHGTVHGLERRTSWEARTLLRYARAVGRRITFDLHGIEPPGDDVYALTLAFGDTSTPERQDRVHWRQVCHELRQARRSRFTAVAMAARLGVTENAVHYWEANPDGSSLISAQRHARGLDGWLGWVVTEAPVHAVPNRRP